MKQPGLQSGGRQGSPNLYHPGCFPWEAISAAECSPITWVIRADIHIPPFCLSTLCLFLSLPNSLVFHHLCKEAGNFAPLVQRSFLNPGSCSICRSTDASNCPLISWQQRKGLVQVQEKVQHGALWPLAAWRELNEVAALWPVAWN